MAGFETLTSGEYIKHHLTNLTFGQHANGEWGIAHGAEEVNAMGFWAIHLDSMFWALALGGLFSYLFYRAAQRASADVPGGLQNFVELMIDFVNENVRGSFSGKNDLIAPLALTVFAAACTEVVIPTEEVTEYKKGKKTVSQKKFLPGYVLVRMDMDDDQELNYRGICRAIARPVRARCRKLSAASLLD